MSNKYYFTLLVVLCTSMPVMAFGETVRYRDLVKRDDVYFKKFTSTPFSGQTTGRIKGSFKSGKRDGEWEKYYENGQLSFKGRYKDGNKVGPWVEYSSNGNLESKGIYLNGQRSGKWVFFSSTGRKIFGPNGSGMYKNNSKISD